MWDCIIKSILIIFTMFASAALIAADFFDPIRSISESRQWKLLLHIVEDGDKLESRVDSPDFFLNRRGKTDPTLELKSTLARFYARTPEDPDKHALCRFPARRMFLEKVLKLNFKNIQCADFENWKKGVDPVGLTLVFASSYPNNPASMFGHTFLRFKKGARENDLLDYGASYAAMVDDSDNPFVYAMKGLFGGYRGGFSLSPYYQKVNEYSQVESRDMWEYELDLKKSQIDLILAHLWELYGSAWFEYYFIDENCSLILGSLINVADPKWNIATDHKWFVMPHDLVKRVVSEVPVKTIKLRAGIKKVLEQKIIVLEGEEKRNFTNLIEGKTSKPLSLNALDAALEYFNYEKMKKQGTLPEFERTHYRKLLVIRSKIRKKSPLIFIPSKNRPDMGHQSSKLGVSLQRSEDEMFFSFSNVQINKDWDGTDKGYEPFSRFKAFGFEVEAGDERITLKKIDLVSATSHSPINTIDPSFSWEVNSGFNRVRDDRCDYCMALDVEGKIGFSVLSGSSLFFSLMGGGFLQAAKDLPDGHGAGWISTMRTGVAPNEKLKFFIQSHLKRDQSKGSSKWYSETEGGLTVSLGQHADVQIKSGLIKIQKGMEIFEYGLGINFFLLTIITIFLDCYRRSNALSFNKNHL